MYDLLENESKIKEETDIPLNLLPNVLAMLQEDMSLIEHEIKCHVLQSLKCNNWMNLSHDGVINEWDNTLFGGMQSKLNLLFGFINKKVELFK